MSHRKKTNVTFDPVEMTETACLAAISLWEAIDAISLITWGYSGGHWKKVAAIAEGCKRHSYYIYDRLDELEGLLRQSNKKGAVRGANGKRSATSQHTVA
jgi:hypothetical protein